MKLEITCDQCGQRYQAGEEHVGRSIRCRKCKAKISVERPSSAAGSPDLDDAATGVADEWFADAPLPPRKGEAKKKRKRKQREAARRETTESEVDEPRSARLGKWLSALSPQQWKIAGAAAGGLLVAVILFAVVGSMMSSGDEDDPALAANDRDAGQNINGRADDRPENQPSDATEMPVDEVAVELTGDGDGVTDAQQYMDEQYAARQESLAHQKEVSDTTAGQQTDSADGGTEQSASTDTRTAVGTVTQQMADSSATVAPADSNTADAKGADSGSASAVARNDTTGSAPASTGSAPASTGAETTSGRPTASTGSQPTVLNRAGINRLKRSTVYVRVEAGEESSTGSGFVLETEGDTGFIVTNSHVVTLEDGSTGKVSVVFNSGQRDELEVPADVVANHYVRDLAVLKVRADQLPDVIPFKNEEELYETIPVYIAGFPFGEALASGDRSPAITVSRGTVSSLRRDHMDQIAAVQIDGSINPGNSGGPIVGADGRLIGIAVATLSGTQIGIAIPARELHEMLKGEIGPVVVERSAKTGGNLNLTLSASLIDPGAVIEKVTLHLAHAESLRGEFRQMEDGTWERMQASTKSFPLSADSSGRISIDAEIAFPLGQLCIQASMLRKDGTESYTQPTRFTAPTFDGPVIVYRGKFVEPKRVRVLLKPDAQGSPGGSRRDTRPPSAPPPPSQTAGGLMAFEGSTETLVPFFCWSKDGKSAFTLSTQGTLTKFSAETLRVIAETKLDGQCTDLKPCALGLVAVVSSTQTVVVIDDDKLGIRHTISVPGVNKIACAPKLHLAYAGVQTQNRDGIVAIDLRRRTLGQPVVPTAKVNLQGAVSIRKDTLTVTPDGRYLFAEGGRSALLRIRLGRNAPVIDAASPPIVSGRRSPIVVSPDGQFVAIPSGGGNKQAPNHPAVKYGTYIYDVDNLSQPKVAINSGPYPEAVGFDTETGHVLAQNSQSPLIVFSKGGGKLAEFRWVRGAGDRLAKNVLQILPHPDGGRAGLLTENHLFLADYSDQP